MSDKRVLKIGGLIALAVLVLLVILPGPRQWLLERTVARYAEQQGEDQVMTPEEAAIFTTDDAISFGEDVGFSSEYRYLGGSGGEGRFSIDGREQTFAVGSLMIEGSLQLLAADSKGALLNSRGAYLYLASNDGKFSPETIPASLGRWLDGSDRVVPVVDDRRGKSEVLKVAQDYMQRAFVNPLSVKRLANVEMNAESVQEATAFTVYPAEDRRAFKLLGLQAGDTVTGFNGIPLTGMSGLVTAFNNLVGARRLVATLERDGKQHVIIVPLFEDS